MTTKFEELMSDPKFRKVYAIEGAITDASQLICDLLDENKMKKADLARLLKKTPAYVSQLLSGRSNMTVKTLAEIVHVLGSTLAITTADKNGATSRDRERVVENGENWNFGATSTYRFSSPRRQPRATYHIPGRQKIYAISESSKPIERAEAVA